MLRPLPTALLCALLFLAACRAPTVPPAPASPAASASAPSAASTASPSPATTPATRSPYDERAQTVTIQSALLGIPKSFYLYTPPGYADEPAARYPTLYLFRGHEREWLNRREDSSRGGDNVLDVYEALLAEGRVGPMILIFPGIASDDNAVPGLLTNFAEPALVADKPGIGTGRFEDFFVQELIPFVDANFRTIPEGRARGVDGFSLGGMMSTKIALQHPALFGSVGAFDGLYFYSTPDCHIDDARDSVLDLDLFDAPFGEPRDLAWVAANNGPTLACAMEGTALQELTWLIQYGPEAAEPNDANYYRGAHFLEQLSAKGVRNGLSPILSGGHRWATADMHLRQSLPLHWATLKEP